MIKDYSETNTKLFDFDGKQPGIICLMNFKFDFCSISNMDMSM